MTTVLHVSDCYLPRVGGIEMHVSDLVARQRGAGYDAAVVTPTPAGPAPADPAWVHRLAGPATSPPGWGALDDRLASVLRLRSPDVVHVHVSVWSPFATLAARRATQLGLPTLVTVHSLWSALGPLPALASALLGLRTWPVHWSAVSEHAAGPLRTMLGPGVAVDVLPNAVDPDDWRTEPRPTPVPTVLAVGRMTRTKRPLALARILRDLDRRVGDSVPFRAVVVGDGPQRARLEAFLRRHRMTDRVALPGRLDRSGIHAALAGADVFVAPAVLESFGIAALEARCAGVPVVAHRHSGVGEFVTHGVDGMLAATDREMVTHLAELLTDPARRAAIATHNRAVVPDLGWDTALERTRVLYERAAIRAATPLRPPGTVPVRALR